MFRGINREREIHAWTKTCIICEKQLNPFNASCNAWTFVLTSFPVCILIHWQCSTVSLKSACYEIWTLHHSNSGITTQTDFLTMWIGMWVLFKYKLKKMWACPASLPHRSKQINVALLSNNRALLYLCRAVKLTRRSRWDWVWTSLFLTECSWSPDNGSTS